MLTPEQVSLAKKELARRELSRRQQLTQSEESISSPSFLEGLGQTFKSLGESAGRKVGSFGAGILQGAHGLANSPHNIAAAINPEWGEKISSIPEHNYFKTFGIENPNGIEEAFASMGQYAPYAAIPGIGALKGAGALKAAGRVGQELGRGGLEGLTQEKEDPFGNAINTGVTTGVVQAGLESLLGASKLRLPKSGIEKTSEAISNVFQRLKPENSIEAFHKAKGNLSLLKNKENIAWNKAEDLAREADKNNVPLDLSNLSQEVAKNLAKLKEQSSKYSGYELKNKPAITFLEKVQNDIANTKTYEEAIPLKQSLNAWYKKELPNEGQVPSREITKVLKDFKKDIGLNLEKNNLIDFKNVWDEANKLTTHKEKAFMHVTGKKGGEVQSSLFKLEKERTPYQNPELFVNDYLPQKNEYDVKKFEQFAEIVGDKEAAKDVLRRNIFLGTIEGNNINPKKFMDKYINTSSKQKEYLFNESERRIINKLEKIYEKHPDILENTKIVKFLKELINIGRYVEPGLSKLTESPLLRGIQENLAAYMYTNPNPNQESPR